DVVYGGAVRGLAVAGQLIGNVSDPAAYPFHVVWCTVNTAGTGLRVALTKDVAGFAAGTTVTVAAVEAAATDGPEPTPTPTPTPPPTPTATPTPPPHAHAGAHPAGDAPANAHAERDGGRVPRAEALRAPHARAAPRPGRPARPRRLRLP